MISKFSFYVGYRYWRARKANTFASFITFFAVSGIVLGVAALIVVSSVMNGLEGQLKNRILGAVPQLSISQNTPMGTWQTLAQQLTNLPHIQGAVPSVTTQAMVQSTANIAAVQVYGIYPELEAQLSAVTSNVYLGDIYELAPSQYRIVVGAELSRKLKVGIGDSIRVLSGDGVIYSPLGPVPSQRKFVVAGVFEMGSMVDANVAYIHYQDAKRLMRQNPKDVKQLRLYLDDPFRALTLTPKILPQLANKHVEISQLNATDWRDNYGHLFAAVRMEKNMMSLMLSLIIAVAAFNIISALVMMVVDKAADVAVLKTQGLSAKGVMGIFVIQGALNSVLGLFIGLFVGVVLTLNLNALTNGLGISILGAGQQLPVQLQWQQLTSIVIGTLVVSLIATIYPALRAARVQPAHALRYE